MHQNVVPLLVSVNCCHHCVYKQCILFITRVVTFAEFAHQDRDANHSKAVLSGCLKWILIRILFCWCLNIRIRKNSIGMNGLWRLIVYRTNVSVMVYCFVDTCVLCKQYAQLTLKVITVYFNVFPHRASTSSLFLPTSLTSFKRKNENKAWSGSVVQKYLGNSRNLQKHVTWGRGMQ